MAEVGNIELSNVNISILSKIISNLFYVGMKKPFRNSLSRKNALGYVFSKGFEPKFRVFGAKFAKASKREIEEEDK